MPPLPGLEMFVAWCASTKIPLLRSLAASLLLLSAIPTHSQIVFDYVKIADTTMAIPNGTGDFGSFTSPANTGSNVVFYGRAGLQQGIYSSAGGVLTIIADTNTPAHGGQPGRFLTEFDTPSARGTGVAFYGNSFSGPAIYRSSGGVLEVIADIETPVPGGTGNFGSFLAAVSASGGLVGFRGNNFAGGGNYVGDGSILTRVVDFTTPIPSGTGTFTGIIPPSVDGNTVVFRGLGSGSQQGIYKDSSGNLSRVADTNTAIPSGTGRFTAFSDPTAQGGRMAFQGSGANGQSGIYLATNGTIFRVANTSTVIPAGSGTFSALGSPSLDGADVAFVGTHSSSSQQGIYLYTGLNGTLHKVVNESTVLDGRTISFLRIGPEGLSGSSIAFYAIFTDGTVGLWKAVLPTPFQPALRIEAVPPASVHLLWPTNDPAFGLQFSTNLNTTNWAAVSPLPVLLGTNNVVTNAASGGQKFYRLFKP